MSRRTCVPCGVPDGAGRQRDPRRPARAAEQHAQDLDAERRRPCPIANSGRTDRRPGQLVERDEPGLQPRVGRPRGRACRTSIGSSVAGRRCRRTPRPCRCRNSAPSTTAMLTTPVSDRGGQRDAGRRPGAGWRRRPDGRRSTRSAIAPAYRPNSSHGSTLEQHRHARPAAAIAVSEATSSGPAASAMPSPRLRRPADDASSHRNGFPRRTGATASRMRPTRGDATQQPRQGATEFRRRAEG